MLQVGRAGRQIPRSGDPPTVLAPQRTGSPWQGGTAKPGGKYVATSQTNGISC